MNAACASSEPGSNSTNQFAGSLTVFSQSGPSPPSSPSPSSLLATPVSTGPADVKWFGPLSGPLYRPFGRRSPASPSLASRILSSLPSSHHVTPPPPPFLDPETGARLYELVIDGVSAPVWSRALEDHFCQRSCEDWRLLIKEEETDKVDLRQLRQELREIGQEEGAQTDRRWWSSKRRERWEETEKVRLRMIDRLVEEGLILFTMRYRFWSYELVHGVSSERIALRLLPFPEQYEPTLAERDTWEKASKEEPSQLPVSSEIFDTRHTQLHLPLHDRAQLLVGNVDFWATSERRRRELIAKKT